ncbi:uncharacterized protein VP01_5126g1, partial [Puccinia sorghi]
ASHDPQKTLNTRESPKTTPRTPQKPLSTPRSPRTPRTPKSPCAENRIDRIKGTLWQGTPVSYCSNVPAKFMYLRPHPNNSPVSSADSETNPGTMYLDEVMRMLAEEHTQRLATEETLRQTQARLDAAAGTPSPIPTSIVLAKPQPYNGTRGATADKVAFAISFMTDYAATLSQPNIQFTSLHKMQEMALKAGQTIEGIRTGRHAPLPTTGTSAPSPDPNAMELLAFRRNPSNRLSDTERARRVQLNLCFWPATNIILCPDLQTSGTNQSNPRQHQHQQPHPNP